MIVNECICSNLRRKYMDWIIVFFRMNYTSQSSKKYGHELMRHRNLIELYRHIGFSYSADRFEIAYEITNDISLFPCTSTSSPLSSLRKNTHGIHWPKRLICLSRSDRGVMALGCDWRRAIIGYDRFLHSVSCPKCDKFRNILIDHATSIWQSLQGMRCCICATAIRCTSILITCARRRLSWSVK